MTQGGRDRVRVNVEFSQEAYQNLKRLADERDASLSRVIRDALRLENWVTETQKDGGKILAKTKDGVRELVRMT